MKRRTKEQKYCKHLETTILTNSPFTKVYGEMLKCVNCDMIMTRAYWEIQHQPPTKLSKAYLAMPLYLLVYVILLIVTYLLGAK